MNIQDGFRFYDKVTILGDGRQVRARCLIVSNASFDTGNMEHQVNMEVGEQLQLVHNGPYVFFNFIGAIVFTNKFLVGTSIHRV